MQAELAPLVSALQYPGTASLKIPFITDGSIGRREILFQAEGLIVEDVEREAGTFRELLFVSNINEIQSEVKILPDGAVDWTCLSFQCYNRMLAGLCKVPLEIVRGSSVLILGAGAGVLANYMLRALPISKVTAVEIDPNVIDVGRQFFNLVQDERLTIEICDAYEYVMRAASSCFHIVFVDISVADPTSTAPPPQFYTLEFLRALKALTHPRGLIAYNTVKSEGSTMKSVFKVRPPQQVFQPVYSSKCTEEKNEVMYLYSSKSNGSADSLLPADVKEFTADMHPLKKKGKRDHKKKR